MYIFQALLAAGADPNIADEFSNVYQVAHDKQLNSLQGTSLDIESKPWFFSESMLCLFQLGEDQVISLFG